MYQSVLQPPVFDSSALLAMLFSEPGSDDVIAALAGGGICGAANWSEIIQKVKTKDPQSWLIAEQILNSFDIVVEPVTEQDAELAADLWTDNPQLPLGDRLCIGQATRLNALLVTADHAWEGAYDNLRMVR
jgi:PIN domain nuclease of toxin-antitoxin system